MKTIKEFRQSAQEHHETRKKIKKLLRDDQHEFC
jgi:hypothetical protein